MSRFKKDTIKLRKKGGKRVSKVDPRVTFMTTKGQFEKKEKVVVQVRKFISVKFVFIYMAYRKPYIKSAQTSEC